MDKSTNNEEGAAAAEPFWYLLYRYFWPFRYFRDVTVGSKMERQQNYRYNRAMRIHLPGFICKWSFLTALWFGVGSAFDRMAGLVLPAAWCFMTGSWTLVVAVLLTVAWLWLERFPELF